MKRRKKNGGFEREINGVMREYERRENKGLCLKR